MIRNIAGKLAWAGRTTSMVFGLALMLALVFGIATTALSATGGNFILGKGNVASKTSKLTANVAGPALALVNNSTAAAATALNLTVPAGKAPLSVNATAGTATNLSADELDGQDSSAYQSRVSGVCPVGQSIREIGADGASVVCEVDNGEGTAPDSELLDGKDSSEFAAATHPHAGEDITSGMVADARIDPLVTRDSEVMDTVKAADGAGSNLDADTVDGLESSALRGARAWAYVNLPSNLSPGYYYDFEAYETSGFKRVYRIDTGTYCLEPAPGVLSFPRQAMSGVAAVDPSAGLPSNQALFQASVHTNHNGNCFNNHIKVVTERLVMFNNNIDHQLADGVAFNVILP